jgi:hypothetical protein
VTGKRLLKRFVTVFLGALSFLVFLNAVESHAATVRDSFHLLVIPTAAKRSGGICGFPSSRLRQDVPIEAQSAFIPCSRG